MQTDELVGMLNREYVVPAASEATNLAAEQSIADRFLTIRRLSERFCEPLEPEDYNLQAIPETSPPKWHLAHTTWFFETFILEPFEPGFKPWNPAFAYLFNSYYNGIGKQFPRPQRGLLSRPSLDEVLTYRRHVDRHIAAMLKDERHPERATILERVELGLHHEQQHQELFFTDIKYSLSMNPLNPAYVSSPAQPSRPKSAPPLQQNQSLQWQFFEGGVTKVGCQADGFCFDNETPVHRVFLEPFYLSTRLASNREFLHFIEDDGYQRPELWLSDGWTEVQQQNWQAPLYWRKQGGRWYEFTLAGVRPLDLDAPVSHISAYEADAFARWCGARLPTEFEWEAVAQQVPVTGHFVEQSLNSGYFHPQAAAEQPMQQLFGTLWEWTSSAYSPYPNYQTAPGAIGEYNGKFMCNQLVLRGGSCVSSQSHLRASYRNFFYPPDRWQFTGIRLAKSGET